jgi:endoglucanase
MKERRPHEFGARPRRRLGAACAATLLLLALTQPARAAEPPTAGLVINEQEYLEMPGLDVTVFHDTYPEGHQGGVTIIQNGVRVAANGDLRLEPTPGQWQPIPKVGARTVDRAAGRVSVALAYPDPDRNRKGFNPIEYPDLTFSYRVHVIPEGRAFRIVVDLDQPLPQEWIGRVGFNLELFPATLFGKRFVFDGRTTGLFPPQLNGPMRRDARGQAQVQPLAVGRTLVVAPESDAQRLTIASLKGPLELLDGRAQHNNGWFVARSPIPAGATTAAIEWLVTPSVLPAFVTPPVIHVSQVGYLARQTKVAYIECDKRETSAPNVTIERILPDGRRETTLAAAARPWGRFARYQYFTLDFSALRQTGLYVVSSGTAQSEPFAIGDDVLDRSVWQPTLETFLPVQMCHMRVNDRYRVWHGLCHRDDARMAPPNTNHFDGYAQGPSTLTPFEGGAHVPGLNVGGWHDAGDLDLRVESQAGTVRTLALAYEEFRLTYDETTIDERGRVVELHQPDGKPDVLQQIEHGVLAILSGPRNLGRLYRGIIEPTIPQYVLLGDSSTGTDNRVFDPTLAADAEVGDRSGRPDDRWVFTELNPARELEVAAGLAAAARVLKGYDDALAAECLKEAESLWDANTQTDLGPNPLQAGRRIEAAAELLLTTDKPAYRDLLVASEPVIEKQFRFLGWSAARVASRLPRETFGEPLARAAAAYAAELKQRVADNPFGVRIRPQIWGMGWDVQRFGFEHYFLHKAWPEAIPADYTIRALDYVLGSHPGANTASFVSGVGARSLTSAYGNNRADNSYVPGGVASGTALIRPDLYELKEWPYLWQQTEYVMGGGESHFLFLVLAVRQLLRP